MWVKSRPRRLQARQGDAVGVRAPVGLAEFDPVPLNPGLPQDLVQGNFLARVGSVPAQAGRDQILNETMHIGMLFQAVASRTN